MIENCRAFRELGTRKTFQYGRWMKSSFARQCKKVGKSHYSYWEYSARYLFEMTFPLFYVVLEAVDSCVFGIISVYNPPPGYRQVANRLQTVGHVCVHSFVILLTLSTLSFWTPYLPPNPLEWSTWRKKWKFTIHFVHNHETKETLKL